jgi:predicted DNA-binding transcriptional regulator AlpA
MPSDVYSERFLPVPVVLDRTSWSRAKLYDAIKKGEFVRPVKISPNRIGFPSKMEAA